MFLYIYLNINFHDVIINNYMKLLTSLEDILSPPKLNQRDLYFLKEVMKL